MKRLKMSSVDASFSFIIKLTQYQGIITKDKDTDIKRLSIRIEIFDMDEMPLIMDACVVSDHHDTHAALLETKGFKKVIGKMVVDAIKGIEEREVPVV